ncbi:tRNA threonylcarbamoyladenosine dehydratase [Anaeromonas frigoriresistens]|uniref:tRNA threonylcarbamoyladenosine dehydratase n=1 Tax=Anaeromonas frigoriresistens TaxID=2683708 RepID=UPI003CCC78EB
MDITNINRQIHVNHLSIGNSKVKEMMKRIKDINPEVEVIFFQELYNEETAEFLIKAEYDYVVDAIDMVSSKLNLIERCDKKRIKIISSMGTGNKLNPTMLEVLIYIRHQCVP